MSAARSQEQRRRRERARAAGKCRRCHSREPRPGLTTCERCAAHEAATQRAQASGKSSTAPRYTAEDVAAALGARRIHLLFLPAPGWEPRGGEWRRSTCLRLARCERDWTDQPALRMRQARCPRSCAGYQGREVEA